ncbi:MAG: RNA polymerase sigma factor [Acidimicrobiales bacterium]
MPQLPPGGNKRRRSWDQSSPGSAGAELDREGRFRSVYRQHARAVLAYALRRCPSDADAQDVVAETFTVAWRRFDDVPEGEGTVLWLYAVARRVLANQRRSQRRREQLTMRLRLLDAPLRFDEPDLSDDVRAVQAALAVLGPKDREILLLAAWERLSHAEIGRILGCSENASAVRLHRARQRLNRIFVKEAVPVRTETAPNGHAKRTKRQRGQSS